MNYHKAYKKYKKKYKVLLGGGEYPPAHVAHPLVDAGLQPPNLIRQTAIGMAYTHTDLGFVEVSDEPEDYIQFNDHQIIQITSTNNLGQLLTRGGHGDMVGYWAILAPIAEEFLDGGIHSNTEHGSAEQGYIIGNESQHMSEYHQVITGSLDTNTRSMSYIMRRISTIPYLIQLQQGNAPNAEAWDQLVYNRVDDGTYLSQILHDFLQDIVGNIYHSRHNVPSPENPIVDPDAVVTAVVDRATRASARQPLSSSSDEY